MSAARKDWPTFAQVRACLTKEHGCEYTTESPFNSDDFIIAKLRRNGEFVVVNYHDDEKLAPLTVEQMCRRLGLNVDDVHIECDGRRISVSPRKSSAPPPADPN